MILVDTSVWIDYLRRGNDELSVLLNDTRTLIHPFVIGEVALGHLINRAEILTRLQNLPTAPVAVDTEVLSFIERQQLAGRGVGYVDAHLLTATTMISSARLWTRDKNLSAVATSLGLSHEVDGAR